MSDRSLPGIHRPKGKFPAWAVAVAILAGLGVIGIIVGVATASSRTEPDTGQPADSDPSTYAQTWGKNYADTTCADWNDTMTDEQQFAASADILASAWAKIEGSDEFPTDLQIEDFQRGIGNVCIEPTMTLTDASYGLYETETRFRPSN